MEDMLFQMFCVAPFTRWCTSSDRPWNKKSTRYGVYIALIFLLVIGVIQSQREEENYFETLGVDANVTPRALSAAYRRLSLQYHPDKNPEPEAKEIFAKITEAYEGISSEKHRIAYDRFGDFSKTGEIDEEQFYDILFFSFFRAVIPLIFGYLYTFGHDSVISRQVYLAYVGFVFSVDVLLRFHPMGGDLLGFLPFVGSLCIFERVKLLHAWEPVILNALILLGSEFFADPDDVDDIYIYLFESTLEHIPHFRKHLAVMEGAIRRLGGCRRRRVWAEESVISKGTEDSAIDSSVVMGRQQEYDVDKVEGSRYQENSVGFEMHIDPEVIIQSETEKDKKGKKRDEVSSSPFSSSSSSFQDSKGKTVMELIKNPEGKTITEKVQFLANLPISNINEEEALLEKMKSFGYRDLWETFKPWRLNPTSDVTDDGEFCSEIQYLHQQQCDQQLEQLIKNFSSQPDQWMKTLRDKMQINENHPILKGVIERKGCTEEKWDSRHEEYKKLLELIDGDDDEDSAVSLSSVIFFGMLFLKWYTGGNW